MTLTGEPRDASVARAHTRRVLGSIESEVADDVLVVVSELVTNALLHGRRPITLTVRLEPPEVVVSVTDKGRTQPIVRHPGDDEEAGRGLGIVHRLTARWHVEHDDGAKTIVAVMRPQDG